VGFDDGLPFLDRRSVAAACAAGSRRQADEGIAAEALAADHRFEQEGVLAGVLALGQLQVQRERRFEVGEGFGDQGNAVVALGGQRFEFEFGHVFSGPPVKEGGGRRCLQKTCRYAMHRQQSSTGQLAQDCQRRQSQASRAPVWLTVCFLVKNMYR
jgi:hypothetical protein